ncbi:MAG: ribonuclease HII [Candidatus Diapherotrites archaeon]|jgi:ribonuclease HII|uniref:Ribonuclease HII n=1 Tax=Candidatus Iainarchaeum sp. TaxID=3101447 RepID=A0A8T5GG65_9ARCH|nr:ribonuclease HII [Candidatus Diapherotrites archaeon]MBT7241270.1 ribonuclease HII [Candidatus Diapherotrites archaeon]
MIVGGIDEAGRGPCFGPMTMSVAVFNKKQESELKKIGVKDSKDIPPNKRDILFDEVKERVIEEVTLVVDAIEINDLMARENLNEIEAMKVAQVINKLKTKVDLIYIDSPDPTPGKYEKRIRKYLDKGKQKIKIIAENKADSTYVVVGAASILAKVTRDREIEKLRNKYGDFGSGYPSDPKTKKYLEEYFNKNNKLPPMSRVFWSTCKKYVPAGDRAQQKLF